MTWASVITFCVLASGTLLSVWQSNIKDHEVIAKLAASAWLFACAYALWDRYL